MPVMVNADRATCLTDLIIVKSPDENLQDSFWCVGPPMRAICRECVSTFQIEKEMERRKLSKTEMAKRMKTSRAAFERLLDPKNTSVTLNTLGKAASALGKKLRVELA
jgi:antitoxin HicB